MSYIGDIALGETIYIPFTTRRFSTGAPYQLAGTPAVAAYVDAGTTEITAGITLGVDHDTRTGLNMLTIVATSGNGYAAGTDVSLVITAGTVDSVSVVGEVVASFSIENRSALRPTTAGRTLDVSTGGEAGVDWANVGSPATTVGLSGTTVKNATDVETDTADIQARLPAALTADGNIKADTLRVGGTLQTAADLAAMLTIIDDFLDTEIAAILEDTGTTLPAQITALNNLSAAQVNAEVVDALATDTYAEPSGVPADTAAITTMIRVLYAALIHGLEVTSSAKTFKNAAGTAQWKKAVSDDGTTYTEAESAAP